MRTRRAQRRGTALATAAALLLVACGGDQGGRAGGADTAAGAGQAGQTAAPQQGAPQAGAQEGGVPAEPTPQMIARGDSIFHGQAANGICYTCHGQDGQGGQLAPNLTDDEWLNTDGTMQGIANVVTNGVAQPKQFPAPMPPMGGADLSREDVVAVAGYVYSLSH